MKKFFSLALISLALIPWMLAQIVIIAVLFNAALQGLQVFRTHTDAAAAIKWNAERTSVTTE